MFSDSFSAIDLASLFRPRLSKAFALPTAAAPEVPEPKRARPHRTAADPFEASTDQVFEVEKIVAQKWSKGKRLYEVQWTGYNETDTTWEPMCNLVGCADQIRAFN